MRKCNHVPVGFWCPICGKTLTMTDLCYSGAQKKRRCRMRSEEEIRSELGSPLPPEIVEYTKNDAYANGYFGALRWVLGEEDLRA